MCSRSRNFTFTMNNYPDTTLVDTVDCRYIVYGKEIGESGTPHLQGTIVFKEAKTETSVRKLLPKCHIEKCVDLNGSIKYCKKDGDFTERGTPPMTQVEKGETNVERYKRARKAAEEGREDDIPADIYLRHYSTIKKIKAEHQTLPAALTVSNNEWIWGPAGTGKTTKAMTDHPQAYLKDPSNRWFDGYDGQDVVIVDDFDKYHLAQTHLLKRLAHEQPLQVELKGGSTTIRPKKIIITSNSSPDDLWEEPDLSAIKRRFKITYVPVDKPWHYSYNAAQQGEKEK